MLQNVHLMPDFLLELEKKLAIFALEGSDPSFRLFLTSDPADSDSIPPSPRALEEELKLTFAQGQAASATDLKSSLALGSESKHDMTKEKSFHPLLDNLI